MAIAKLKQRLIETARPFLQEGEVPDIASIAFVGSLQRARSAAIAAATLVASAGTMAMISVPVKQYVLLTDRRLLFFEQNQLTGRPMSNLTGELPRAALTASPAKRGLMITTVDLAIAGTATGVRLRFPLPARADARSLAQTLPATAVAQA